MELILKAIKKIDASNEMEHLELDFIGDFNQPKLQSELDILPTIFKQSPPVDFSDVCSTLQEMDKEQRPLIENVWTIIQTILTSGATLRHLIVLSPCKKRSKHGFDQPWVKKDVMSYQY